MKIITNNQTRELVSFNDIPAKAQTDFDYIENDDRYSPRLFKYRGAWYDVNEFMRANSAELKVWDGYQSDTFFSGTLVKYADCYGETVIVGRYYS